jgi:hypothetical protein
LEASIAFVPGRWKMPIATAGWVEQVRSAYWFEPSPLADVTNAGSGLQSGAHDDVAN